jgi:hypothetical protein
MKRFLFFRVEGNKRGLETACIALRSEAQEEIHSKYVADSMRIFFYCDKEKRRLFKELVKG